MGDGGELPHRSSSPLKRRASSMDPEQDATLQDRSGRVEDVDMTAASEEGDGAQQAQQNDKPEMPDPAELEEQVKELEELLKAFQSRPFQEGDCTYLVSRQWLTKAQAYKTDLKHAGKEAVAGPLGPVDNSDIIQAIFTDANGQKCVQLKPGLGMQDFELFPEEGWQLLLSWFPLVQNQAPIIRYAHNTAPDSTSVPNVQVEFYPPVFLVHRLWSANSPVPIQQEIKAKAPPPPLIVQSTSCRYHDFLKNIKHHAGIEDRAVRVWRIIQTIPTESSAASSGMKTPPDSPTQETASTLPNEIPILRGSWPELLVDVEAFVKLERGIQRDLVDARDTTMDRNYNGSRTLALVGLLVDQVLVLDEEIERAKFISTWINKDNLNKSMPANGHSGNLALQVRNSSASGRSSPANQGPLTRGRAQQMRSSRTIGCVGLQNLGNTCYMNSALQCVRSVEELTKYFLSRKAYEEINPDNPLSHNGDVARAYGRLLEEIYRDPAPASIAPRQFKGTIGRYASAFSGYGQQDSQEFLGFLLDGLQEDLNRIKKKPYIEKPDSTDEMVGNTEAIKELADKFWDITKRRDDSVIADLFTGMYQSTVTCPRCHKVSITFDPFNNLTLPLPMANCMVRTFTYYPLDDAPVKVLIDMDKNCSFATIKQWFSGRFGVPVERLIAAEEFSGKFFKYYDDSTIFDDVTTSDQPTVHELEAVPTNIVPRRKKQKYRSMLNPDESDECEHEHLAERLLVPVVHRLGHDESTEDNPFGSPKVDHPPPPHFILVTPQEARSQDAIRRKVLEKVATFSTLPGLHAADEGDAAEGIDPDMVAVASDVDSSGDPKVVAKSVEGEEDMVDVTMKDASDGQRPDGLVASPTQPSLLKRFQHKRPGWVNPDVFLDAQFQNMFEMGYWQDNNNNNSNNSHPTNYSPATYLASGWNIIHEDKSFPRLSTRLPPPPPSDVEMQSPPGWAEGSDGSGSEESIQAATSSLTRMTEESSDDDSELPSPKNMARPQGNGNRHVRGANGHARGGRKKMKGHKTYGKKQKRLEKEQRKARSTPSAESLHLDDDVSTPTDDSGALLRLSEGLIIDWNKSAFRACFKDGDGSIRPYVPPKPLEDPEFDARQKQRDFRKENGLSLDDCLAEFEKQEILSEHDTWYCPRCKEHQRASKKFDLWKTPDILVVHLKRFSSSGYRRDKLDTLVDFPVEGLDLTPRVIHSEDGKEEIYDLIAVDDHWGGLGGGHYTAFAKNFVDGEWYEYNDSSVTKIKDTSRVISSAAYLLFYRRRSNKPLGGPLFQQIHADLNRQRLGDEDDTLGSGEGQRPGQGSSLRGSPGASAGAGQVLLRGAADHGLDRVAAADDDDTEMLPSYHDAVTNDMGAQPAADWSDNQSRDMARNSIEADDEGIGLSDSEKDGAPGMQSVIGPRPRWNFDSLAGQQCSQVGDDDIASDRAQLDGSSLNGNSEDITRDVCTPVMGTITGSADMGSDRLVEATLFDPDLETTASTGPLEYDEQPPPSPAPEAQDRMSEIAEGIWKNKLRSLSHGGGASMSESAVVHTVVPADEDGASDKVDEIHLQDDA